MSAADRIVAAARGALGVRFRPQGRDPDHGLDCIGLAALALRAGGFRGAVPGGYALRGGDPAAVAARIEASGLRRVGCAEPGDLLLFATGPGQLHLAIAVPGGLVHADATLRRVTERPGDPLWPVLGTWRLD
jgi:cell wall-associated NlpC family hydrolase